MWINCFYYPLDIRFYLSLFVNLQSHFSNFADLRQLQIPNAQTKYNEILPGNTKTPLNTTRKIANRYFELKNHFLTLQKNPITFEQGCTSFELVPHRDRNCSALLLFGIGGFTHILQSYFSGARALYDCQ